MSRVSLSRFPLLELTLLSPNPQSKPKASRIRGTLSSTLESSERLEGSTLVRSRLSGSARRRTLTFFLPRFFFPCFSEGLKLNPSDDLTLDLLNNRAAAFTKLGESSFSALFPVSFELTSSPLRFLLSPMEQRCRGLREGSSSPTYLGQGCM